MRTCTYVLVLSQVRSQLYLDVFHVDVDKNVNVCGHMYVCTYIQCTMKAVMVSDMNSISTYGCILHSICEYMYVHRLIYIHTYVHYL